MSPWKDPLAIIPLVVGAALIAYDPFLTLVRRHAKATRAGVDAAYWRNAYEALVKQTGRDLNDGLGLDPRVKRP